MSSVILEALRMTLEDDMHEFIIALQAPTSQYLILNLLLFPVKILCHGATGTLILSAEPRFSVIRSRLERGAPTPSPDASTPRCHRDVENLYGPLGTWGWDNSQISCNLAAFWNA